MLIRFSNICCFRADKKGIELSLLTETEEIINRKRALEKINNFGFWIFSFEIGIVKWELRNNLTTGNYFLKRLTGFFIFQFPVDTEKIHKLDGLRNLTVQHPPSGKKIDNIAFFKKVIKSYPV